MGGQGVASSLLAVRLRIWIITSDHINKLHHSILVPFISNETTQHNTALHLTSINSTLPASFSLLSTAENSFSVLLTNAGKRLLPINLSLSLFLVCLMDRLLVSSEP